jgi:3-phosphoshikimate 1-carboxyvinyltransferase
MKWKVKKSRLAGAIAIPASKSHTIRAMLVATLAKGESHLSNVLTTGDGASAISAAKSMGASVAVSGTSGVTMQGVAGNYDLGSDDFNMENSGTSTNLFASAAALGSRRRRFDGDSSLRTRPFKPLLVALKNLGAIYSMENNTSDLPFTVAGPIMGGRTVVNGVSSQFVSSLLFSCPCAPQDTHIDVENLHERPYVEMTLHWLDRLGIGYEASPPFGDAEASPDRISFLVRGRQVYPAIDYTVPGDFSSATFAAVAAPLTGSVLTLTGLDFSDPQGDKGVFDVLAGMGATIDKSGDATVVSGTKKIEGRVIDLNAMPDSLPAFSVLGCIATGETRITNVAQARIKETDRIAVMTQELAKMGADVREEKDGLLIRPRRLAGAHVNGHGDHRVVMALALAGMVAEGETVIDTTEAAAVTYPTFLEDFKKLGAEIKIIE